MGTVPSTAMWPSAAACQPSPFRIKPQGLENERRCHGKRVVDLVEIYVSNAHPSPSQGTFCGDAARTEMQQVRPIVEAHRVRGDAGTPHPHRVVVVAGNLLSLRLNLGLVARAFLHDQFSGFGRDLTHLVDESA